MEAWQWFVRYVMENPATTNAVLAAIIIANRAEYVLKSLFTKKKREAMIDAIRKEAEEKVRKEFQETVETLAKDNHLLAASRDYFMQSPNVGKDAKHAVLGLFSPMKDVAKGIIKDTIPNAILNPDTSTNTTTLDEAIERLKNDEDA